MRIQSIAAVATIALIAGVGSVSADEITVDSTAVNTGMLYALPAGVATPMTEAELDAVRGQGPAGGDSSPMLIQYQARLLDVSSSSSPGEWELFFDGSAIGH